PVCLNPKECFPASIPLRHSAMRNACPPLVWVIPSTAAKRHYNDIDDFFAFLKINHFAFCIVILIIAF
ncbi:hypothetical protein JW824_03265, partial [bacterium]|nr:hypothetical protein [bacterium]